MFSLVVCLQLTIGKTIIKDIKRVLFVEQVVNYFQVTSVINSPRTSKR